jgi:hypothetical protein
MPHGGLRLQRTQIERMVGQSRRLRIRFCVAAVVILVMALLLALYRPTLPIFHEHRAWGMALLTSLFLFPLKTIWRWRKWPDLMRNSLRETRVEVASGTVGVSGPFGYKRQLNISEIVRAEEPSLGTGLYLRTSNRYRWILIPRKLDGYDAIKRELAVAGAAVVKRFIPTHGEEFVFSIAVRRNDTLRSNGPRHKDIACQPRYRGRPRSLGVSDR